MSPHRGGPGRGSSAKEPASIAIRAVYAGRHRSEPDDLVPRVERGLRRRFDEAIAIEQSREPQGPASAWPADVGQPRDGELTVLVQAVDRIRCGVPAAAGFMLSAMTFGLVPFVDRDDTTWTVQVYDGPGQRIHQFDFDVRSGTIGWLPFVPLVPFNVAWRWIRGDEYDYFVRVFPDRLYDELGALQSRR